VATLRDVAQAAGVSTATVSRTFNTPGQVAELTRLRVQAAVDSLDYHPNKVATLLRVGRTGYVGILVPDLENPYFARIIKGAQEIAHSAGLTTLVVDSDENPRRESELFSMLRAQADGIVLCSPRAIEQDLAAIADSPIVLVNSRHEGMLAVNADYQTAMIKAVEHLRALGHRHIAYIRGPGRSWASQMRLTGLALAGETFTDVKLIDLGGFTPRVSGGVAAADLATGSGATAIIAFNDLVAIGLLNQLALRGVRVPEQMSIIGCDDSFVAEFASVPLTTIHVDLTGMGAHALEMMSLLLSDESDSCPIEGQLLPTELVVRASTGPAPR